MRRCVALCSHRPDDADSTGLAEQYHGSISRVVILKWYGKALEEHRSGKERLEIISARCLHKFRKLASLEMRKSWEDGGLHT